MKLNALTRSQLLNAELKANQECFACVSLMIDAGRGLEKPTETRTKTDPLSVRYCKALDQCRAIDDEKSRRIKFRGDLHRINQKGKLK